MPHARTWWKEAVVYQVYPRSFVDSNGDGEGDIPGIISKLDYLQQLGVTVVWVSPFFKSPQYDNGYDVSDYQDVHEPYGKVSDVEALIDGCHRRGLKVLFDLVINHTSDQHPWFLESRSSKTNPKRDWYIWRPGKIVDGYYLHVFSIPQPDLNWENPEVRQMLYENACRFWLDKGCDGFRIDTANFYSKPLDFPDAPVVDSHSPWQPAPSLYCNGPRIHEFLKELYTETFGRYDCMTIGESGNTPRLEDQLEFVSADAKEMNMIIQGDLMFLDHGLGQGRFDYLDQPWKLSDFKAMTIKLQQLADPKHNAWACSFTENHDGGRSIPRWGSDAPEHRVNSAKILGTYLLSLSGTPIVYQGQEIGMVNCPTEWSIEEEYKDITSIEMWRDIKAAASAESDPELLRLGREGIQLHARDHTRTPMQWNNGHQAGFSTAAKTWMRVMDTYKEINVAAQEGDPNSTLEHYRRLIALRKQHADAFVYGDIKLLDPEGQTTMLYLKKSEDGKSAAFFALNFSAEQQEFELPEVDGIELEPVQELKFGPGEKGKLGPYEAQVFVGRA